MTNNAETTEKVESEKIYVGTAPKYWNRCQRLGRGFDSLDPLHFFPLSLVPDTVATQPVLLKEKKYNEYN